MGYTHYWYKGTVADESAWSAALAHIRNIVSQSPVPLDQEDEDGIWFNGVGEDAHETFVLPDTTEGLEEFQFCKTAAKPYDVIVTAALATMHHVAPGCLKISTDGTPEEWQEGVQLARTVTGLPIGPIMTAEQWAEGFVDSWRDKIHEQHAALSTSA